MVKRDVFSCGSHEAQSLEHKEKICFLYPERCLQIVISYLLKVQVFDQVESALISSRQ
jgi:hypothetical protein